MEENIENYDINADLNKEINAYEGFFTNQRSADLILKICFSLVCFLIFLLATAWHITRKSYVLPSGPDVALVSRISDIFSPACRRQLASTDLQGRFGSVIGCRVRHCMITILNDQILIQAHYKDSQLDTYFTCASDRFCRDWRGILFTHSNHERKVLRKLILYSYEELPLTILMRAVHRVLFPLPLVSHVTLSSSYLRSWAWRITFDFLLSDHTGSLTEEDTWELGQLSGELYPLIVALRCLHFGTCGLGSQACTCSAKDTSFGQTDPVPRDNLMARFKTLLAPTVRHAMENYSETADVNFVGQFIKTKLDFDDQGNRVGFLTVSHLTHVVAESALLSMEMISISLDWIVFLLATHPNLQLTIWAEAEELEILCTVPPSSPNASKNRRSKDSTARVDQRYHATFAALNNDAQLVYTKAFVSEVLRLACPQGAFDLRRVERDGNIGSFDYREGDLLLFNQLACHFDTNIWGNDATSFNCNRFIQNDPEIGNVYNPPGIWSSGFLSSYTVFLPGDFLVNLLVLLTSGLCLNYDLSPQVQDASPLGLDVTSVPGFALLPQKLPNYTFMPHVSLPAEDNPEMWCDFEKEE